MNELITVKQLPIIEEHLRALGAEIDERVSSAVSLVCTEDTVKDVKSVRACLNKQFAELEAQRKAVKAAVLGPYEAFESIYRECVSNKFKTADAALMVKISDVEIRLKAEKQGEVVAYFLECCAVHHIDWLTFDRTNINITLSASMKSLKDQARKFVEQVADDIAMAAEMEHGDEIVVEYQHTLRLASSVQTVRDRHKAMEEAQMRREAFNAAKAAESCAEQAVEAIAPAVEVEAPQEEERAPAPQVFTLSFTVTATMDKLRALKQFLTDGGYEFK